MKKKRFTGLFAAALAMCLILTACGSGTNPSGTNQGASGDTYTVTFDLNADGAAGQPEAQSVKSGENATAPVIPTLDGSVFYEWTTDKDGFSPFSFDTAITSDLTLYASWGQGNAVTFDLNFSGAPSATIATVEDGQTVTEPAKPSRDGYEFTGWYADAGAVTAFDFETAPTESMTVYAGWHNANASYVTVSFNYNYEGAPAAVETQVEAGATASAPATFVRDESHAIEGWYSDAEKTTEFDFSKPITENTTVYAKWITVLEAEYIDVTELKGVEYSSNFAGAGMIEKDSLGYGASNGYYITYIYLHGTQLTFNFTADRADDNAMLSIRVGSSLDFDMSGKTYQVEVNGKKVNYSATPLTEEMSMIDVDLGKVSVVEGENTIVLTTVDTRPDPQGLIVDNAPNVDCLKISSVAEINWNPALSNIQ